MEGISNKILLIFLALFTAGISNSKDKSREDQVVFVITVRSIETLDNGSLVFTNEIDTNWGLKFIRAVREGGDWYVEEYKGIDELLEKPAPYQDWAVWVHGDGQTFLSALDRAVEIQSLHQVNFLVFSWPTRSPDKEPISNFRNSRKNAILCASYLSDFLILIQNYRLGSTGNLSNGNLSIFFHSLANYMLETAVEKELLKGLEPGLFDNLILNAAVTESNGHNKWVGKLDFQDRVYIISNDGDVNLAGLRAFSRLDFQLGERPEPPLAGKATYLDFTDAVGFRLRTGATHSYYYAYITQKSINIRDLYTRILHGQPAELEDLTRFVMTTEKNRFLVKF